MVDLGGSWPFRGTVVWLTPEQGGRRSGPPATAPGQDYAATAVVPPHTVETGLASFVLRGLEPGAWRSPAEARWLAPEAVAADRPVSVGTTVLITEGPQVVGYLQVEEVRQEQPTQAPDAPGWRDRFSRVVPRRRRRADYEIALSHDVALVVFEWLAQRQEEDWAAVPVSHPGELGALAQLSGALERTLVETFDPRYDQLLAAARSRLAAEDGADEPDEA